MVDYHLSEKYKYTAKTTTKGCQTKYYKDGYYYKLGKHEAICEDLASRLLSYSNLSNTCYVGYEKCLVNGVFACRSKSFLNDNEEFLSINTLYRKFVGKNNFSDYLQVLRTPRRRLQCIIDIVDSVSGLGSSYLFYLKTMMLLDMLIINSDRHVHNYGIIYSSLTGRYRIPPLFDNGCSLVVGQPSCTLSGSYEDQVLAFGYPVTSTFKIDYMGLYRSLAHCSSSTEIGVLKGQLERYKGIFNG